MTDLTIDGKALREACGQFATGVTIITTPDDEEAHGMTANAFMSVSLAPPLIAISLDNGARMLSKIRRSGRYAVNILAEGMDDVALHFAGRHNPDLSALLALRDGMPVVPGATVQILTDVVSEIPAGDHTMILGHVRHIHRNGDLPPLLFHCGQFQKLLATA